MSRFILGNVRLTVNANDVSAFIPEIWAQESLRILEANTVMLQLVNRDFEPKIASYGEVVTTRRPSTFTMDRKTNADDVVPEDVSATPVQVKLDQHLYKSFVIKDGEESKSFPDLVQTYLEPAVKSIAKGVDQILSFQAYDFMVDADGKPNMVGRIGQAIDWAAVVDIRRRMNAHLMPDEGRACVITPGAEADLLNIKEFVNAEKTGDAGSVLRSGSMGRRMGIDFYMCQNTASVPVPSADHYWTDAANADTAAGATSMVLKTGGTAPVAGEWFVVAGDDVPQMVTGYVAGTKTVSFLPGLVRAVKADAVITHYLSQEVDKAFAVGYAKKISYDTATITPATGQLCSFGVTSARDVYGALSTPTGTATYLNRSLDTAVADNDQMGLGPAGDYCFAFQKDAIMFVSRPLALPAKGAGALSYVANYRGLGIRVTIAYEARSQGHLVTVDLLCGIKTIDRNLGVVVVR